MPEIVEGKLDLWVVNRLLENLAIDLKKRGPGWLGLRQHVPDRLLKHIRFDRALNYVERDDVPLCIEATRFLRKPYV